MPKKVKFSPYLANEKVLRTSLVTKTNVLDEVKLKGLFFQHGGDGGEVEKCDIFRF